MKSSKKLCGENVISDRQLWKVKKVIPLGVTKGTTQSIHARCWIKAAVNINFNYATHGFLPVDKLPRAAPRNVTVHSIVTYDFLVESIEPIDHNLRGDEWSIMFTIISCHPNEPVKNEKLLPIDIIVSTLHNKIEIHLAWNWIEADTTKRVPNLLCEGTISK